MTRKMIETGGKRLYLTNLGKVLYPVDGFTKADIIEYYSGIAKVIIPHVEGRALTLKRYPNGVQGDFFFEKRCPLHRPEWTETAEIIRHDGEKMTVCLINNLETLIWVANLASLELHIPLAKAASPETADSLVFDLDPGEGAGILDCARVALILKDLLAPLHLASFVKTSGKKGLHVFVPLNNGETTFEHTKTFSRTVAGIMQQNYPDLVTANMAKTSREGKVFINWSQNDASKTMVSVYSLRAGERPLVSFPLEWRELEQAFHEGDGDKLRILNTQALKRVEQQGDLFQGVLTTQQRLPYL